MIGKKFKVIASFSDLHLGGLDFDRNLATIVIEKIKYENLGMYKYVKSEPNDNDEVRQIKRRIILKLVHACEKAKIDLSSEEYVEIDIQELYPYVCNENLVIEVSGEEFEEANEELFDRCE